LNYLVQGNLEFDKFQPKVQVLHEFHGKGPIDLEVTFCLFVMNL